MTDPILGFVHRPGLTLMAAGLRAGSGGRPGLPLRERPAAVAPLLMTGVIGPARPLPVP